MDAGISFEKIIIGISIRFWIGNINLVIRFGLFECVFYMALFDNLESVFIILGLNTPIFGFDLFYL